MRRFPVYSSYWGTMPLQRELLLPSAYFAGYTITPASEIAERMSERMPQVGGRFIQMEDEIGSIFPVIGASLAGVKAMTATASDGYNYMLEGICFAVTIEVPCVIVNVQSL